MKRSVLASCVTLPFILSPAFADSSCAPVSRGMEIIADEPYFMFVIDDPTGTVFRIEGRPDGVEGFRRGEAESKRFPRNEFSGDLREEARRVQQSESEKCFREGEESLDNRMMEIFISSNGTRFWVSKEDERLYKVIDGDETSIISYEKPGQ